VKRSQPGHLLHFGKVSYGAREHLDWLLSLPEFLGALDNLRDDGQAPKLVSLAWREYGVRDLDEHGSTLAPRYRTRLERTGKVLPPPVRPLLPTLVLNTAAPIDLGPGYCLTDEARVAKLQDRCCRHLAREQTNSADRKGMAATLELIKPSTAQLFADVPPELVGHDVAVSATAAEAGSWLVCASAAGYPVIGRGTTGGGIEPFIL
jgi:hypothetical protein